MSGRVCFLERSGDVLSGVRLFGLRTEDTWRPRRAEAEESESAVRDASAAALWIAERAPDRKVGYLCVDVDGSNCLWLTSPAMDPVVLAAAMNGSAEGSTWSASDPAEVSIQALSEVPATNGTRRARRAPGEPHGGGMAGRRLAVLSVPDAMARVTIDALDARGVEVVRAGSLWHAMASAWDPGSPLLVLAPSPRVEGALSSQSPVTAVVLVDPLGRLVWSWSRAGELLAGGAIMTPLSSEGLARVGKAEVGRLVADWLAWSVQLGVTPSRTVCVTPALSGSEADLSERELGAAIGRGWPGATVDLAVMEDPIGATLGRIASAEAVAPEGAGSDLVSLNRRPRRVHKSMYLWGALAIALFAAGLLAVGVKAWNRASAASVQAKQVSVDTRKLVLDAAPPPQNDAVLVATAERSPRKYIEERLKNKKDSSRKPTGMPPVRPISPELENLSLVLGNEGIELEEIRLSESFIHAHVYVPDSKIAEDLKEALERVANDHCDWKITHTNTKKNTMQLIWLEGTWKDKGISP